MDWLTRAESERHYLIQLILPYCREFKVELKLMMGDDAKKVLTSMYVTKRD